MSDADKEKDLLEKANEHYLQMCICNAEAERLIKDQKKRADKEYEKTILMQAETEQ